MKEFLRKKDIEISFKRYGIDVLAYMTQGLFASLIVGLIISVIGEKSGIEHLKFIGDFAMSMMGPAIGVSVALGLKAPPLVIFTSVVTGAAGAIEGGPAGALIAVLLGAEFGKLVSKETKIDIIVTPLVTMTIGVTTGIYFGGFIGETLKYIGMLIMAATELSPILMGIIVSVIMGMVLTLPISSAALGIMLDLNGLAAGAATVGCACQMVGFAAASFRDNDIGGIISQGIGTSMLQMPNIIKNPAIWIPPTLASAILGPLATTVFKMENLALGSGMGTSGLVGQFTTLEAMGYTIDVIIKIGLLHFILPIIVTLAILQILIKINWIKPGDMKI